MSSRIRGLPPRVVLREKDCYTGSIPTNSRVSSDNRTGMYNTAFFDKHTIVFTDSSGSDFSSPGAIPLDLRKPFGHYLNTSSLVAYWRFEPEDFHGTANSIVHDRSFVGTHALTATVLVDSFRSFSTPGKNSKMSVGSTLGTRFFQTEDRDDLSFGNGTTDSPFSVCAWVKLNNFEVSDAGQNGRVILAKSGSSGREYSLHIDFTTTRIMFRIWDTSTGGSLRTSAILTTIMPFLGIKENEWFHIAGTYNASGHFSGLNMYINGKTFTQSKASQGSYTAMENMSQSLTILGAPNALESLEGYVDDVAIFNRELSREEIAQIACFRQGISMPSGLDARSPFLDENIMTNLFITGTARPGVSDQFISFTPGQNILPFRDHERYEQSRESAFYITGSDGVEIGNLGFSSPLKSKSQIHYSFNIGSDYTFPSLTASLAYLTFDDDGLETVSFTNFASLAAVNEATDPSTVSSTSTLYGDAKLFGPFGTKTLSGSSFPNGHTVNFYSSIIQTKNTQSALVNNRFDPSAQAALAEASVSRAMIPLSSSISSPFLLEKAVIRFSLSASSDWLNSKTLINAITPGGASPSRADAGGPCITVGLLNHRAGQQPRDLILSATIIPVGDAVEGAYTPPGGNNTALGFHNYGGRATANISANTGSSFVGEVHLESRATVSHGIFSIAFTSTSSFGDSQVMDVNPIGRSMEIKQSGRSKFRNDFLDITNDDILNISVQSRAITGSSVQIFRQMKNAYSPYLLMPNDNLVLCIAKHRPSKTTPASASLTGTHTLAILSGTNLSITLYGSLIKNDQEHHDSLNQLLTSRAVSEGIYCTPPLDQFDVEPKTHYISSSLDAFLTGNMVSITNGVLSTSSRTIVGSSIIKQFSELPEDRTKIVFRESCAFQRFKQFNSTERYYDSLLPKPDKMFKIQGKTPFLNNSSFYNIKTNVFYITDSTSGTLGSTAGNRDWVKCFPFESKFSTVERTVDPFRETTSEIDSAGAAVSPPMTLDETGIFVEMAGVSRRIGSEVSRRPGNELVAKVLFGIGDGVSGSVVLGPAQGSNYVLNVKARGVKYGLVNWKPCYSKMTFRKNQYRGMRADILEQRLYTKFRDDDTTVSSSPVQCTFANTDPELTFSSNLDFECTSSLPYFDGLYTNRSTLISGSS